MAVAVRIDVKIALLEKGLTQRSLAGATEIPENRLSNIIRGISWPSSTERSALAEQLGKDYFATEDTVEARSAGR